MKPVAGVHLIMLHLV